MEEGSGTICLQALAQSDVGLIDLRCADAFAESHVVGSTSLPWEHYDELAHVWPAPGCSVNFVSATREAADEARAYLVVKRGFVAQRWITLDDASDLALWQAAPREPGTRSRPLWQPCPALALCADEIDAVIRAPLAPGQRRSALDVACGSGRDMVFMAMRGWNVVGVDYLEKQLVRTRRIAQLQGVDVTCLRADVEHDDGDAVLQGQSYDLVIVSRYLHRPLFPWLWDRVRPGGVILYHTFMRGAEAVGRKTPTKDRFLLEADELANLHRAQGWFIARDDVIHLPDGRPMSAFLAVKPIPQ